MTDTTRLRNALLIEKAARAVWHSVGGVEDWETLDEDDYLREVCLAEAEAALEAVGFFDRPAQDALGLHLAATVRKMLSPVSTLPSPQRLELEAALEAVERLARV